MSSAPVTPRPQSTAHTDTAAEVRERTTPPKAGDRRGRQIEAERQRNEGGAGEAPTSTVLPRPQSSRGHLAAVGTEQMVSTPQERGRRASRRCAGSSRCRTGTHLAVRYSEADGSARAESRHRCTRRGEGREPSVAPRTAITWVSHVSTKTFQDHDPLNCCLRLRLPRLLGTFLGLAHEPVLGCIAPTGGWWSSPPTGRAEDSQRSARGTGALTPPSSRG